MGDTTACFGAACGRFLQNPPHSLGRDRVHHLQFDEAVGQPVQHPARLPVRRGAAGQGDDVRLLLPVQFPWRDPTRGPAVEGGRQPLFDVLLPKAGDGRWADLDCRGDPFIDPARPRRPLVSFAQDAGVAEVAGWGPPCRDQAMEFGAFLGGQCDRIVLVPAAKPTESLANPPHHASRRTRPR